VTVLNYLAAFVPMLGVLIFVHELGHFVVAKLCGVRVLKFSLGFGPPIGVGRFRLRWVRNGTEYVVAWFPLGGFVKMLGENLAIQGEDPPEIDAAPDEYLEAKPTWQKLSITLAGPAMNLLLPVVVYTAVLAVGVPRLAAVVGMVDTGSPAALAGLAPGDRVLSIEGVSVEWWDEVDDVVRGTTSGDVDMRIERNGEELHFSLPVALRSGLDELGASKQVGWVGINSARPPTLIGVPDGDSLGARSGLLSGDLILSVNGTAVEMWAELRAAYAAVGTGAVALEVERGLETTETESLVVEVPGLGDLALLGLVPATVLIEMVVEDTPASRAGLQPGDLILAVDGRPVGIFASFRETVLASEGRTLQISYARDGATQVVAVAPEMAQIEGALGPENVYRIGIANRPTTLAGVQALDIERNPLIAIPRAVEMTVTASATILRAVGKFVTGEFGRDKLGGPIAIMQAARKSLDLGWQVYLFVLVNISINLGILNLLPIPILDGGQALIFAIEGIKRSPLSLRTREFVQSVGLTMLMMLMGLAFWNDISRNWSRFVEWLTNSAM
jgi:regulator of sigma E protease